MRTNHVFPVLEVACEAIATQHDAIIRLAVAIGAVQEKANAKGLPVLAWTVRDGRLCISPNAGVASCNTFESLDLQDMKGALKYIEEIANEKLPTD